LLYIKRNKTLNKVYFFNIIYKDWRKFMLFDSEKVFIEEFSSRAMEKYGLEVKELADLEAYTILGEMVRDYMNVISVKQRKEVLKQHTKQLVYFSMEFLIGRLLESNLLNLGLTDLVSSSLKKMGFNLGNLVKQEADAGLGNGGLGRLAACFLDSIASVNLVGHGNCIRYDYGFFRQKILNGAQEELPDQWLLNGFVWENRKPLKAVKVKFYGREETYTDKDGNLKRRVADSLNVLAIPYDVSIPGYHNGIVNTLKLWSAEPSIDDLPQGVSFNEYLDFVRQLTFGLYPDDRTEQGKLLRLRQQYFVVSAGLQTILNNHYEQYHTLDNLADYYVFHLNDTHPILAIPELMRLLMDDYSYSWEKAYEICTKIFAFTNHTVMPEALEKWPVTYLQQLFPRIYLIIEEINRRLLIEFSKRGLTHETIDNAMIIKDGMVRMCQLAINVAFSINGVASLHTEILKAQTFRDLYSMYPNKFNNKTNGISLRRFLMVANPSLNKLISSLIGPDWILDPENSLKGLLKYQDDEKVLNQLLKIKKENKKALAELIYQQSGLKIDNNMIVDSQIKRLHAYKRQLLNVFRIIYYYLKLKNDKSFKLTPHLFVFGAKAAPSYYLAKKIIELINSVAQTINNDKEVNKYIKVVFIENYDVSKAQVIIPASDFSEQISTAGKEASGTSNMKFMANGAITLGTLDGANVEISQLVGLENSVIFGLNAEQADALRNSHMYNPYDIYNSDLDVKKVLDSLVDGTFSNDKEKFRIIYDEILNRRDEYFVLKDFKPYLEASKKIEELYLDQKKWAKMCLINIAYSGYFSSDRTIKEYNRDVWYLQTIKIA